MFASNRGDVVCPISIQQPEIPYKAPRGFFGVGTWGTQAEYKDVTFTSADGKSLFAGDFSKGMKGWRIVKGDWKVEKDSLRQTGKEDHCVAVIEGSPSWGDGVFSLKARKQGGREGFQVLFQAEEEQQQRIWNLGGWNNTLTGLQGVSGDPQVPGSVKTGRWYDIRIELAGPKIRCFLDGKLVQELVRTSPKLLYALAGRSQDGKELILKVVNTGSTPLVTKFDLKGLKAVAPKAKAMVLTSKKGEDENSFEKPRRVAPVRSTVTVSGKTFARKLPPLSVTILRIPVKR
jgi:alpha-L-arabinofuranosidase